MTEEELLRTASRLGDEVVQDLDGERLARAVLARLAAEPVAARSTRRLRLPWLVGGGLAAAAAILLMLRLGLVDPTDPSGSADPAGATLTVLHELDDLSATELEALLETLPPPAAAAVHPEPGAFDELDTRSLERLLRSLEG